MLEEVARRRCLSERRPAERVKNSKEHRQAEAEGFKECP
jgi:hypothetical protein